LEIRRLRKKDSQKLQNFIDELSKKNRDLWYPPKIEEIYRYFALVAISLRNEMVGIAFYIPCLDYDYPSTSIVVADAHHRKGIGTKLMKVLFDSAIKNGYKGLYVGVLKENFKAIHFYRRLGFIIIGEKFAQNGEPAWEMRKE